MIKRLRSHTLCIFAVFIIATLFRLLLISSHWPSANGDESIINLMAYHIAYNGEHMVFFYGQNYMGALEAYLSVPFYLLIGPTAFSTHLMLLLLYTGFSISMYILTRLLYTRRFALAITILMTLGSGNMLISHLRATGGYPEIQFFGAALIALAVWLALITHTTDEERQSLHKRRQRFALYTIWGLLAGLALWSDLLILPIIVAFGAFLFFFCWRDMRFWGSSCLLGGLLLGAAPLIIYNLQAAPEQTSLHVLLGQASPTGAASISYFQRLSGAIFISEPPVTGANPLCPAKERLTHINSVTDFFTGINPDPIQCAIRQGTWAFSSITFWLIATLMALVIIWKLRQRHRRQKWSSEEQRLFIRQAGRFTLLLCTVMIFLPYAISSSPGIHPSTMARYIVCLAITIPAVLWPLWVGVTMLKSTKIRAKLLSLASLILLTLLFATYLRGTLNIVQEQLPRASTQYQQRQALIQKLIDLKATRFYSEYWTCNNLIFESREQLICSNLQGQELSPGHDRYQPYHDMIASTPHPAYVFLLNSNEAKGLDLISSRLDKRYKRIVFDNYLIYYYANP